MSDNSNKNDLLNLEGESNSSQIQGPETPQPNSAEQNAMTFGRTVVVITCLIVGVIFLVLLVSCLAHKNDLKYTVKSLSYIGDLATAVVEVQNNTDDYVSYTLDFQIWDRYGEWVGYQFMTIRLDPHMKKEFEIVARCSTWDLDGSKGEVRVY